MTQSDSIIFLKGLQLNNRILELSTRNTNQKKTDSLAEKKLVLSFDLYCLLTEYFVLLNRYHDNPAETLEELFDTDHLIVELGNHDLIVKIDFTAPPNTLRIV